MSNPPPQDSSDDTGTEPGPLAREISLHYSSGYEANRLSARTGQLEFARTQELLQRYLPPPPAVTFDVGGGPGAYALWLAALGYEVHLVDAMPLHVEQARRASEAQPEHSLASTAVGDARQLDRPDESVDVVLLLGPLYHLTERADRVQALREARRILRRGRGGLVVAAAISRFASTLDGLFRGYLDDPEFARIARQDLVEGQHRNPANHPSYFTTAYFHLPSDLKAEMEEAGLRHEATLGVEGPGWLVADFDERWQDNARRERLLDAVRWLEREPEILGVSAHILAVGYK
jgi:ubiquinone/menaquinone biosynthesis C-methylase UbiE